MNKIKKMIASILIVFTIFGSSSLAMSTVADAVSIPKITVSGGTVSGGLGTTNKGNILEKILDEYRDIVAFISGIGLVSMIMFFIFNFIELGNSKGNPQARQKAIVGLITSGIATAGLGAVFLIAQLFYNMIS